MQQKLKHQAQLRLWGVQKVSPDTANINVGVETINPDASVAERENSEKITQVIKTLVDNGVKRENIKTTNYYMHKKYDYQSGQIFVGYQITNGISFTISTNENIPELIAKITENGITNVNGIIFTVSSSTDAYNQALSLALENARLKARTLAGGKTLNIVKIKECDNNCGINFARTYSASDISSIEKGEIKVSATVKVEFELI